MLLNESIIRHAEVPVVHTAQPDEKDISQFNLDIRPIKTDKSKIKQRPLMESNIIPRHPSSVIFNGSSGSGKSVLLLNLLTRPEFFQGYYDTIHLFSPTGGSDDLFRVLKLDDENIHLDMKPSELADILEEQRAKVDADGVDKADKVLLIFEDCQGNGKFMRSNPFLTSFIANRHYNVSTWLCGQSWTRTPKACRLQANNIFYFQGSGSENELLAQEYCPPGLKKREFISLLRQGTRGQYNFIHINTRVPHADRYRRNLGTILKWDKTQAYEPPPDKPDKPPQQLII